jgi:hypothetical protein
VIRAQFGMEKMLEVQLKDCYLVIEIIKNIFVLKMRAEKACHAKR